MGTIENFISKPGIDCSYTLKEVSAEDCACRQKPILTEMANKTTFFIVPKILKKLILKVEQQITYLINRLHLALSCLKFEYI